MADKVLRTPGKITLGSRKRSTFVVPDVSLPPKFAIIRPGNRGYLLTLGTRMGGTLCLDGEERDIADFVRRGGEGGDQTSGSAGQFRATPIGGRDWGVIDLDPEGVRFSTVVKVALKAHEICQHLDIPLYPKTSGKTGIHLYIPMGCKYTYEQVKDFIHLIAMEINKQLTDITSLERLPVKRKNRVYLDYLQNNKGQTLSSAYSVRPTKDASVSAPLKWEEVTLELKPSDFTIKNLTDRLKKVGDLWKPVTGKGINMKKILRKITL